jgi:hypothetical protein
MCALMSSTSVLRRALARIISYLVAHTNDLLPAHLTTSVVLYWTRARTFDLVHAMVHVRSGNRRTKHVTHDVVFTAVYACEDMAGVDE